MTQNTQNTTQAVQIAQENDAHLVALEKITGNDGFTRAITIANKVAAIRAHLTAEVMAGVMQLQGKAYGFRTDKVYGEDVVADCTIEAQIAGVLPVGNQMNILAGRMYVTKEGFKHLLDKIDGLRWMITPQIPKMVSSGAEAPVKVEWRLKDGEAHVKELVFPIRVNAGMGADAINGKATRKAEAWLYNYITGMDLADGDAEDAPLAPAKGRFNPIDVTPKEAEPAAEPQNFAEAGLTREQVVEMYDANRWPKDGMERVTPSALKEAWEQYQARRAQA